ncbi:MAG: 4-vinyl reductase [Betaproteobacteria bacterium]|nr:4-vinyl reductase [Betaproteobacteria bacterium]
MARPALDIDVDEATGEWRVDGMPMILVPRHFLVNNHVAVENAIGQAAYAKHLHEAGYKSAWQWCEKEAATHGLAGLAVFHHYMKRLSQRGWAQFRVEAADPAAGTARVRARHSVFVSEAGPNAGRKTCYMFLGWLVGSLEWVRKAEGLDGRLRATEVECGAEGAQDGCVFEVSPGV